MDFRYFDIIRGLLETVEFEERKHMEDSVELLFDCVCSKGAIYTFGAGHAGILSEELYFRAGGLMLFNPIFGRELMLDTTPVTQTTEMERLVGYGTALAKSRADFKAGDVLIAHSVSGRNPAAIEVALSAREVGVKIIAVTSLKYSEAVTSRHSSGKRLFELADVVLDNHGAVGDASVRIDGLRQRVSATSTVVGATILNAIVAALVQKLVNSGVTEPPVFHSANLDGGDELNRRLLVNYRDCIKYEF